MKLNVVVDDRVYSIEVPPDMLREAEEFFQKMDRDMDRGWQMGPEFIENPGNIQRCQIAADKLLVSLSTANETLSMLMAGYILKHLPGVTGVRIDTGGEMLLTEMIYEKEPGRAPTPLAAASPRTERLSKIDAMEQAGKDVTKVYKVGRSYRYAVRDPLTRRVGGIAPHE
ncbi:MAG: hypothetical protein AAB134_00995 [Pseudomonadota bacterium]